jgi:dTDP-4-amino-4,6-dideoxygalactose transaminase
VNGATPAPAHGETAPRASAAPPSDVRRERSIPIYRPLLPQAGEVARYLGVLDATRTYANHGPLVRSFETRLEALFCAGTGAVVSAASGTAALTGAILGSAGRAGAPRPYALCPAYTFAATASAIQQCGYQLHLCDVDPDTWTLDPDRLARHPLLSRAGVVVVVAPYGRMPDLARWAVFESRTGVPVVVDGAAAFEQVAGFGTAGTNVPVALSFHATKAFATGEGGAVICADALRASAVARALNFGFLGERVSRGAGINGKMSEYHAAVGLAELDGWERKRAAFATVYADYRAKAVRAGVAQWLITAPTIASCYALFCAGDADEGARACAALADAGVAHRRWYGRGLHAEPAFAASSCDALAVADDVAARLIGVPTAPDLQASAIERVVNALAEVAGKRA